MCSCVIILKRTIVKHNHIKSNDTFMLLTKLSISRCEWKTWKPFKQVKPWDWGKYLPCFVSVKAIAIDPSRISHLSPSLAKFSKRNASRRLNWTPRSSRAAVDFLIPEITHMRPRSMWSACQALWTTSKSPLNHVRVSAATGVEAALRYCFSRSQMSV